MTITGNFIGGKTVTSASNNTMPVFDPATGKVVREVTLSTTQEVSDAIQRRLIIRQHVLVKAPQ